MLVIRWSLIHYSKGKVLIPNISLVYKDGFIVLIVIFSFLAAKYPDPISTDRRRYLGVTMLTLTNSILLELQARGTVPQNIPPDITHGIFIWRVVVGSPAYQ